MLRALVVALIAANLLFFAWARGWLAPVLPPPQHGEREPERLAQQVKPETVRLYASGSAASAAVAAASPICVEAGPLAEADAGVAEAALLAAGVPSSAWAHEQVQAPPVHVVYMGRFTDAASQRTKEDELRRRNLAFDELREPPDLAPGLVLSRHDTKDAAETALAEAARAGVRTARVVTLPAPPPQHWLRIQRADPAVRSRLAAVRPVSIGAAFGPCRPR